MITKAQAQEEKLFQNSVAMTVTLIAFGMLFATMFLGFFLVRFNTPVWPPVEIQNLPIFLPLLSTLVMGFSSFAYYKLEHTEAKREFYWKLTFSLGLLFLVLQYLVWGELNRRGIFVTNGQVPSMVIAFSWVHAAHILLALGALLWLRPFIFKKKEGLTPIKLINVGKFWHFLGVIWLLMYLMMFVL